MYFNHSNTSSIPLRRLTQVWKLCEAQVAVSSVEEAYPKCHFPCLPGILHGPKPMLRTYEGALRGEEMQGGACICAAGGAQGCGHTRLSGCRNRESCRPWGTSNQRGPCPVRWGSGDQRVAWDRDCDRGREISLKGEVGHEWSDKGRYCCDITYAYGTESWVPYDLFNHTPASCKWLCTA